MLARRKPPKLGLRETPQIRCDSHLKWVRGFECVASGHGCCSGRIEAAHKRTGTDGGMSVKPSDTWAFPACTAHHAEQHSIGELSFQAKYGLDLDAICKKLALTSPHKAKWEGQ